MTDRLLTAEEVADLLNVPTTWVRDQTRSGAMPTIRLGRYCRYERADVLAWLAECKQPGRPIAFRTVTPKGR